MGRPRAFATAEAMAQKWEEYKTACDNEKVPVSEFCQKSGAFVSAEVRHRVAYNVTGFCAFCHMSPVTYYETYRNATEYADVVTQINTECEADLVKKAMTGEVPSKIAPLLLGKYGYGANNVVTIDAKELVDDWINAVTAKKDS